MSTRRAGKASTWYKADAHQLDQELRENLAKVPETLNGSPLPIPGARVIIAPHAGYFYSGPCAAWAYKSLDLSKAKRVFVLGPSHTYYLEGCAVSNFENYATPFGNLVVDRETTQRIREAAIMGVMNRTGEVREHSLEMHMPYLYYRCWETFGSPDKFPQIIPILVGNIDQEEEKAVGRALVPYLRDPENAFIISSDFCHWGGDFHYQPYTPTGSLDDLTSIREEDPVPNGLPIYKSIKLVDQLSMDSVESGSHAAFWRSISRTGNTVCGRHPIGVMLAALEALADGTGPVDEPVDEPEDSSGIESGDESDSEPDNKPGNDVKGRFYVVQYQRSKEKLRSPGDSSVSYVSAYAVL